MPQMGPIMWLLLFFTTSGVMLTIMGMLASSNLLSAKWIEAPHMTKSTGMELWMW